MLLPRGLEVLGAVDFEQGPLRAGRIALQLRKELQLPSDGCIVAAAGVDSKLQYSWFDQWSLQALEVQEFDDKLWEKTTFLRCQLPLRLPLYLYPTATASGTSNPKTQGFELDSQLFGEKVYCKIQFVVVLVSSATLVMNNISIISLG